MNGWYPLQDDNKNDSDKEVPQPNSHASTQDNWARAVYLTTHASTKPLQNTDTTPLTQDKPLNDEYSGWSYDPLNWHD